jgi:hypothetical protein
VRGGGASVNNIFALTRIFMRCRLCVMTNLTAPRPEVEALQAQMFAARLRLGPVLKRAGMSPGTWSRWTRGAEPKLSSLQAVQTAIHQMLLDREASQ